MDVIERKRPAQLSGVLLVPGVGLIRKILDDGRWGARVPIFWGGADGRWGPPRSVVVELPFTQTTRALVLAAEDSLSEEGMARAHSVLRGIGKCSYVSRVTRGIMGCTKDWKHNPLCDAYSLAQHFADLPGSNSLTVLIDREGFSWPDLGPPGNDDPEFYRSI